MRCLGRCRRTAFPCISMRRSSRARTSWSFYAARSRRPHKTAHAVFGNGEGRRHQDRRSRRSRSSEPRAAPFLILDAPTLFKADLALSRRLPLSALARRRRCSCARRARSARRSSRPGGSVRRRVEDQCALHRMSSRGGRGGRGGRDDRLEPLFADARVRPLISPASVPPASSHRLGADQRTPAIFATHALLAVSRGRWPSCASAGARAAARAACARKGRGGARAVGAASWRHERAPRPPTSSAAASFQTLLAAARR